MIEREIIRCQDDTDNKLSFYLIKGKFSHDEFSFAIFSWYLSRPSWPRISLIQLIPTMKQLGQRPRTI